MGGGDLLNLLIERDIFEEDFTRFYVAEVRPSHFTCRLRWSALFPDGPCHRVMPQTWLYSS